MVLLKGWAVTVDGGSGTAEHLERLLREARIPVIARRAHDRVWLSVRTIEEDEFDLVAQAFCE